MKNKQTKKQLALTTQTVRALDVAQLTAVAGAFGGPTVRRIYSCGLGCIA